MPGGTTATFVFTNLANSTEVLLRAGDEHGRRIFNAHHAALREAAIAHGGHQVKWNHDGGFFAFPSVAEAVRFAIAGQQWAAVPRSNERLELKVGLNTGEAFFDGEDYFGAAVVLASRLCDAAASGQVLCSNVVAAMLHGVPEFSLTPVSPLTLKGIAGHVDAFEVQFGPMDPATALANIPFVGRQREVSRLRERYQRAARGEGGLVLVAGEPGIGKTRLVEQAGTEARELGALVLVGHCYEGDWAPPYAPFGELLAACIAAAGADSVAALAAGGAPVLARIAPALQALTPAGAPTADDRESQFRLLEAVGQLFIALAERSPLVLVIDDLQWADAASLSLLRYVARVARQHRILVFCTYRDVDVGRLHPLTPVLNALRREVEYDLVQLVGLETPEVATFIASAAARQPSLPPEFAEAVHEQTEGNPFFIREMLLHLRERGLLVWEGQAWALQGVNLSDFGIPEGARQVIARRVDHAGELSHRFLRAAAIFDGPFPFVVAAGTAGLPEEEALLALEQSIEARLVAPVPGNGAERYDFTHALIRGTLAAELSPSRRMRMHRDAVAVLEAMPGPVTPDRAFELSAHCRAAGELADPRATAQHCLQAGGFAFRATALEEAVLNFETGLPAAESLPEFDPLARADALRDLTRAYQMTGRGSDAALPAIEQALRLYESAGTPAMVAEALLYRAALQMFRARPRLAVADLESARAGLADEASTRPLRARLAIQLGQAFTMLRRYSAAESTIAEALALATGDEALAAEALLHLALCRTAALQPRAAEDAFEACAAAHDRAPAAAFTSINRATAANRRALVATSLGDFERALGLAEEGERFFRQMGDPYRLSWPLLVRGTIAGLRGRGDEARDQLEQALQQLQQNAPAAATSTAAPALLWTAAIFASPPGLEAEIRRFTPGDVEVRPANRAFEALAAIYAGKRDEAAVLLTGLSPALAPRTPDVVALPPYLAAAEFALRFRDVALARAVSAPLRSLASQELVFTAYWPALLARLNGGLATVVGDHAGARGILAQALATAERSGAVVELALVHIELAWLAAAASTVEGHARAAASARAAEALCEEYALEALLPRVEQVRRELESAAV